MKKCCVTAALSLVRIATGLAFLVFGLMKLGNPTGFIAMLDPMLGLTGTAALIAGWVVIAFEALGGLFVLLGKIVGNFLYKLALTGQAIILVVAIGMVQIMGADTPDWMGVINSTYLLIGVIAMLMTQPKCMCGVTGHCEVVSNKKSKK